MLIRRHFTSLSLEMNGLELNRHNDRFGLEDVYLNLMEGVSSFSFRTVSFLFSLLNCVIDFPLY